MKTFFKKNGLGIVFIAIFILIFAFGGIYSRFMTNQISVHQEETAFEELNQLFLSMFDQADQVKPFTTTPVDIEYMMPNGSALFSPVLVSSYKVYDGQLEVGVVYVITSYGKYEGLQIAYAISSLTNSCIGVKLMEHFETPLYFSALGTAFYQQFENKSLDDIGLSVDAVSGSTYSSVGFEIGLFYAREQYAQDFGFSIPSIIMTINSVTYNFDVNTFVSRPFIADVTYGEENTNVVVYLNRNFEYVSTISGSVPTLEVQNGIKSLSKQTTSVSANSYFYSYDASSREVIIVSKGYSINPIFVKIYLNASMDAIVSYVVDTNETYDEDYNEPYLGGEHPEVENYYVDEFLGGSVLIDSVAGATVTSSAMQGFITLLNLFMDSLNGGN